MNNEHAPGTKVVPGAAIASVVDARTAWSATPGPSADPELLRDDRAQGPAHVVTTERVRFARCLVRTQGKIDDGRQNQMTRDGRCAHGASKD